MFLVVVRGDARKGPHWIVQILAGTETGKSKVSGNLSRRQPCKRAYKDYANMASNHPSAGRVNSAILTKQEAAQYVRCTARYLERQVKAGRLRALKPTGKLWRVRRSDLEAFLESGATIGGGE